MYDISIYGGDKTKLTRKERMRRRARRMIKAGLREDQYVTSNSFIAFIALGYLLIIILIYTQNETTSFTDSYIIGERMFIIQSQKSYAFFFKIALKFFAQLIQRRLS